MFEDYLNMYLVAVHSKKLNSPNLKPILITDISNDCISERIRSLLLRLGVEIVFYESSIKNSILTCSRDEGWKSIALGAFLRLEIPKISNQNDLVLYTDLDVIFLKEILFEGVSTNLAMAPEFNVENFDDVNSGVMLFNPFIMKTLFEDILSFIDSNLLTINDFDQGPIRSIAKGRWDGLSPVYNWKPYWGINPDARVIHFHGPKPTAYTQTNDLSLGAPEVWKRLYLANQVGYKYYLDIWRGLNLTLFEEG